MRFFSPPEKPSLTPRDRNALAHLHELHLLLDERQELVGVHLGLPAALRLAFSAAFSR